MGAKKVNCPKCGKNWKRKTGGKWSKHSINRSYRDLIGAVKNVMEEVHSEGIPSGPAVGNKEIEEPFPSTSNNYIQ